MFKEDEACVYPDAACKFDDANSKYPAEADTYYYARGPLGIHGSKIYGMFGDSFGPIKYDGKKRFLESPDELLSSDYIAFASAIAFYMTPNDTKPSMHDIITHYWMPNGGDAG
jgi:hypothetical protein